jgi:hypothetical protein
LDSQTKYNIGLAVALSIPLSLQLSTLLIRLGRVDITMNKYIVSFGVASTAIYSLLRFYWFNQEMDKKYSAIWLKSTGKLDK